MSTVPEQELTQRYCRGLIRLKLPINQKIKMDSRCQELEMTQTEYIIYLMEKQDCDDFTSVQNFRYNLIKRIKKGINLRYINELKKLHTYLGTILQRL